MDNLYEKLGSFYLGREYDVASSTAKKDLVLYDSKDINTHAVIIGMTGSGKTGLGVGLLEEALIDNIPVIAIDPKGDLTNLSLTFPELRAEDFRPWINEQDALTKGLTPDDYAAKQAQGWSKGLADWDQSPERIGRLRNAAECVIYTPGSNAGLPISILRNFSPPPQTILEEMDVSRARKRVESISVQLDELDTRMQEDIEKIEFSYDAETEPLHEIRIKPKSTDITLDIFGLAWIPFRQDAQGHLARDWPLPTPNSSPATDS